MSADCLPVFLADPKRRRVGIVHAGWRGLAAGIIERTLAAMSAVGSPPENVHVAFGPAIAQRRFEVGDEVREALVRPASRDRDAFRQAESPGKWFCDLYQLAACLLYTSPSPRDATLSRMPSSA